ncbi:NTF2 fold immunity protein [Halpernia frigidisoli]|uniref:NTF2 fold immunity protein n=1 Tax=Halpernia frigidisoli TaxID=1125876 RepID=A0A1I3FLM7_9FLAO|nr:NTF2 fold immunity protein [Halpernia frigidisoli]SFI12123.1 NTF2 fold immunity protein [Halpernia frigidisoli]
MKIYSLLFVIVFPCTKKDEFLKYNYSVLSDEQKSEKAVEIAEIEWNKSYGKEMISNEKPFSAKKINDSIWFVQGTQQKVQIGGVAFGKVDVKNKAVLEYSHGE